MTPKCYNFIGAAIMESPNALRSFVRSAVYISVDDTVSRAVFDSERGSVDDTVIRRVDETITASVFVDQAVNNHVCEYVFLTKEQ